MKSRNFFLPSLDGIAITLSSGCIVHCLFLPILISILPTLEGWVAQEWIHKLMVLFALPITGLAIINIIKRKLLISTTMLVGLSLLLSAAFIPDLHHYETPMTICGALILAGGHFMRWRTYKT